MPSLPHNPPVDLDIVRHGAGNGPSVAVLPRPSGDMTRLSLWIDAGSRDAQPPQVATLAAWLAADAAGGRVEAHVEPEGSELALWCPKNGLHRCLGALRRALALRAPSAAQVRGARARLVSARRRAEAADPDRDADRLALRALYGDNAPQLWPLGEAGADEDATEARVRAFLADHYGPNRALLVAVGEVEERALIDQANAAFATVPRARTRRAATRAAPDEGGVQAGVDSHGALSIALAAPDLAHARAVVDALQARLARDELARWVGRGHAMALRGHALAMLRLQSDDPVGATRALTHELERLRHEGWPSAPHALPPDAPSALARRLGERWAAHGAPVNVRDAALGIGVLVAGGRADKLSERDPDSTLRERTDTSLQQAWDEGRELAAPDPDTSSRAHGISATLANGARVELRASPGERVALAVRFGIGAAADPPAQHGRAALLSMVAATACAGLEPEQLQARTRALGAEIEPRVSADGWGLLLTAPKEQWQRALALGIDCALSPGLARSNLSAARLRLLERLGPEGGAGEMRAEVAELLSPAAPGALAPWGHPARQASISLGDLRELWRASRYGGGVTIGVAGPVPAQDALSWIARRVATLPEQPPAQKAPEAAHAQAAERPRGIRAELAQPTLGLAVWQVPADHPPPSGGQAFAALVRAELRRFPGVTASWHDGGASEGSGWAAVAVTAPPERLPMVAAALRDLGRTLPAERLAHAADTAFALERERAAERAGTVEAQAEELSRGQPDPTPSGSATAARQLAARLAASEPRWVTLR